MLAQLSGEENFFFSVPVKSRIVPASFSPFKLKMDEMNILVRDKQYIQQSLYEMSHLRGRPKWTEFLPKKRYGTLWLYGLWE